MFDWRLDHIEATRFQCLFIYLFLFCGTAISFEAFQVCQDSDIVARVFILYFSH